MHKIIDGLLKVFIVLILLSGLADLGVAVQYAVKGVIQDFKSAQYEEEREKREKEELAQSVGKKTVLLLGASQLHGYDLADEFKIQAVLQKKHDNLQVLNRSIVGHQIEENLVTLQENLSPKTRFDQVFVVNGIIDLLHECNFNVVNHVMNQNNVFVTMPRLEFIYAKFFLGDLQRPEESFCQNDMIQAIAVQGVFEKMQLAQAAAVKLGVDLKIILPPMIMDRKAYEALGFDFTRRDLTLSRVLYQQLDAKIKAAKNPNIISMADVFSNQEGMFTDDQSHFSAEGMEKFSDAFYEKFLK